jgi:hypothetical protein
MFGRLCLLWAFALCGLATAAIAPAEWRVPPLDGALEGEFRPLTIPHAPTLHWKVVAQTLRPGVRVGEVVLDGPGTRLHGEVRLDPAGVGTWRLAEAQVDVAVWSEAVLAFFGEEFIGAVANGTVRVTGDGTMQGDALSGQARLTVRGGRVEHAEKKLLLHGISADIALEDLAARRSASGQSLRWDGGTYEGIPFGLGHVEFSMSGDTVHVAEASVEVFGGEVVLSAFSFSTQRREVSVIARVIGIEVGRILPYLPPVLASARGRVDGSVALRRTPSGVQIGNGTLALRAGQTADLRLAPTPGLLSSSLPDAVLKYYPGLGKIETGEVPLRADHLEVTFSPGGDALGRTAAIRIVGGPVDPSLTAPVDLNVNVRGPLESLIKFGTDSRLRFGGGK